MNMRIAALLFSVWLAACGPSAPSSPDDVPDDDALPFGAIVALGAAPDWRLDIDPNAGMIVFADADGELLSTPYTPPQRVAEGRHEIAGDIAVTLEERPCTLGGVVYPMSARTAPRGRAPLDGCAAMRWDYQLMALMPQIDACLAQAPDMRTVVYAGESAPGETIVRMQGAGSRAECRVRGESASLVMLGGEPPLPSEGAALFVRAPGENPGGECYAAPEVRDAAGRLLGWMADPQGC